MVFLPVLSKKCHLTLDMAELDAITALASEGNNTLSQKSTF